MQAFKSGMKADAPSSLDLLALGSPLAMVDAPMEYLKPYFSMRDIVKANQIMPGIMHGGASAPTSITELLNSANKGKILNTIIDSAFARKYRNEDSQGLHGHDYGASRSEYPDRGVDFCKMAAGQVNGIARVKE